MLTYKHYFRLPILQPNWTDHYILTVQSLIVFYVSENLNLSRNDCFKDDRNLLFRGVVQLILIAPAKALLHSIIGPQPLHSRQQFFAKRFRVFHSLYYIEYHFCVRLQARETYKSLHPKYSYRVDKAFVPVFTACINSELKIIF